MGHYDYKNRAHFDGAGGFVGVKVLRLADESAENSAHDSQT